jgi:hypothetical protein
LPSNATSTVKPSACRPRFTAVAIFLSSSMSRTFTRTPWQWTPARRARMTMLADQH